MARASDTVRELIEKEISRGKLRPGDLIDEKMLSERFQVSRTPAREAIMEYAGSLKIDCTATTAKATLNATDGFTA